MARLLPWINGLAPSHVTILSSPKTIGAGGSTTIGNFTQRVSGPTGAWVLELQFPYMHGAMARRFRGLVHALHGGANAVRYPWFESNRMTEIEAGVAETEQVIAAGQAWSNGEPWSNGMNWQTTRPVVSVGTNAFKDATQITLANEFWGHQLDIGDRIGFFPFHLGCYEITEVISAGTYRISYPLRANIRADTHYATLTPTMAMRLAGEDAASLSDEPVVASPTTMTLMEVLDYDARDYFTG